ncbi:MAG: type II toxin-antitoxin system RelE/ParE family toxin [Proteobacteria bacterium]|nr:type II toxin-antitoxin system RelE/ParE family toxin [Pseudomonadota bacterium]
MTAIKILRTSGYQKRVKKLLSAEEQKAAEYAIAAAPTTHPVVPGTGGVRKARWGVEGSGKRGGVRIIYLFVAGSTVYMFDIYGKTTKADLTADEKKALRKTVKAIKDAQNDD